MSSSTTVSHSLSLSLDRSIDRSIDGETPTFLASAAVDQSYFVYIHVQLNVYSLQARIQKIFQGGSNYTHLNTIVLWIDFVWCITVEVQKYEK